MYDKKNYYPIDGAYLHSNYYRSDKRGIMADITLIKLEKNITFDENTQPACLDFEDVDIYNETLLVSGWGSTHVLKEDRYGEMEPAINSRFLKVGETFDQSDRMKICEPIKHQNICTDNKETNDASCFADSGGPLQRLKDGKMKIIGIVSWGPTEIDRETKGGRYLHCTGPDVYVRLSYFKDFIEKYLKDDYCS